MKDKDKILKGVMLGVAAGIIDVVPMIMQGLTWDANISAFCLWVISGFLISTSNLKLPHPALKGLVISVLVLTPSAVLIGWQEPVSLVPIGIMTLILGSLLGWLIEK